MLDLEPRGRKHVESLFDQCIIVFQKLYHQKLICLAIEPIQLKPEKKNENKYAFGNFGNNLNMVTVEKREDIDKLFINTGIHYMTIAD